MKSTSGFLVLTLIFSSGQLEAADGPAGSLAYAAAASSAEASLALSSAARLPAPDELIRQQELRIESLIAERGAFGYGLEEAYGDAGKLHLDLGNLRLAQGYFRQAWHLSRISHGLYGEEQMEYLNQLIEVSIELRHWQEAHDLHQLNFLVSSRLYQPGDIRYLLAAEFYTSWQWQAINSGLLDTGSEDVFQTAQELSAFYTEVIDKVEHAGPARIDGFVDLVLGKARTDISIARALLKSRLTRSVLGPGRFIPEKECFDKPGSDAKPSRQCRTIRLSNQSLDGGGAGSVQFVLGRYLKQIEGSIARLERIQETQAGLSNEEREWVMALVSMLRRESNALLPGTYPFSS